MPVYIRTGDMDIPAPSISACDSDDESGVFVLDPEQITDKLPQPFRMIDKVLNELLEVAWDKIVANEKAREEEANEVQPPTYQYSKIDDFQNATYLCHSGDIRYLFVAFESGELAAFDAITESRIAEWNPTNCSSCVEYMTCSVIGVNVYLLATLDDMGFARLMIFATNTFYLVQLLNEEPEGSPKSNCNVFNLSKNGDFCGLSLQCQDKSWLEFYKLPRDNWLNEIEIAQKEALKRAQLSAENVDTDESTTDSIAAIASETFEIKFSPLALALRVKSPAPLCGTVYQNFQETLEKVGSPNTVGDGTNHLFTAKHIEIRRLLTKKMHEDEPQGSTTTTKLYVPTWHFLYASRMQAETMMASPGSETTPVSVCVLWKNSYVVHMYPLQNKIAKDPELKPDLVWPMSDVITTSCVSECTNIVGFGLLNGFVAIIDRYLCIARATLPIKRGVAVKYMYILDGSITSSEPIKVNPPPVYCLIGLIDGEVFLLDCDSKICKSIISSPDDKELTDSFIMPIPELLQAFLWAPNHGKIHLHDALFDHTICTLAVSQSLEPPQSRLFFSCNGEILYAKNDDGSVEKFNFRNFSSLDQYYISQTASHKFTSRESIAEKCQRLLSQRMFDHKRRTEELISRWKEVSTELVVLMNMKVSTSPHDSHHHTAASSRSVSRWSDTTDKVIMHNKSLQ